MNTRFLQNQKRIVFILVTVLMVTFGTQLISYAQETDPTITASVEAPLTEANLHGSVVTLTLSGGQFTRSHWDIVDALTISGIDRVTFASWDVDRVSDTEVTIELNFAGDFDTDATLTFTVGSDAIVDYNGNALTVTLPVIAIEESLTVSTEVPLTEATLHGSVIILTLNGVRFADSHWRIRSALSVSGIEGVTFDSWDVDRVSDTEVTIELNFAGDFDTDATLTFTVGSDAIVDYNGNALTVTLPVIAIEESLTVSTEVPLTEATLHGSVIILTLNGVRFADSHWRIRSALSVSGIEGVTFDSWDVYRVSDTEVIIEFEFAGDFDTDATLTFTVEAGAIAGYNGDALTATLPVKAVEESLTASTAAPLTEVALKGSIITLTLNGRRFFDRWDIERGFSVAGIEGVTVRDVFLVIDTTVDDVIRVIDTVVNVKLGFDGTDFDTDATLTFTVEADAIAGYNRELTAQIPVAATQQSNATVSISPASIVTPDVGKELTFSLNIKGGENVAGYQATVLYNYIALDYVRSVNGDYLPADTFFMPPVVDYRSVTLAASTLAGASNGDGTLATITFQVADFKASTLTLSQFYLVDTDGKRWEVTTESAEVTIPPEPKIAILGDINRDGIVNIQDLIIVNARFGQTGKNSADINGDGIVNIMDLVLVAGAFGNGAAAPALSPQSLEMLTTADIQRWLFQAQQLELTDATSLRGIRFLEQLLAALMPKKTVLLANYPNPFNPETWIPYQLSKPADVTLTIYGVNGKIVRQLALGHQPVGIYQNRSQAAHWDGKNEFGESVVSGLYFYTLTAGNFSATRKMLIMK